MNVKVVKLVTNEEVLCEIEDKGDTIVMKNPIMAIPVPDDNGQMGLALAPWMALAKTKEIEISKTHVICLVEPKGEIYNHYSQACGVGIVVPERNPGHIQI